MPKAAHFRYHRHFKPLTIYCDFPPERIYTPLPLTQHMSFSRDMDCSVAPEVSQHTPSVVQSSITTFLLVKIPKPRGDVSRIKRGGYNLHEALGWPSSDYEETHTFIVHLTQEHLKINKSWSSQAKASLTIVYAEAKKWYRILDHYEDNWVVSDMLRIFLKNSSSR
ncbi:uncharacterized protein EDB93DRAFT_1250312 [Suillus bovinus]|uniref:uncharacterized protein n=1 Tax=Suillus bovinus TaxID=48563 RepID=UPI001B86AF40|nr:uncharacterized protein EDB93DRAFT_1250308 [Suillus bovinus]XP_041307921.1 uncharacterized protein EDB93DRAFT_1250312 [Suillus bovinus]KAG2148242.1 hypothetical protein EDB93DRAFT_1250308 [Suillus bovinus]KAG2148243.1 hypothetical protein EDB93DRAFT_1250312 [Suillus bovinus]